MRHLARLMLIAFLTLGMAGCGSQSPDEMLGEGNQLFSNKDLYGAQVKFQKIIEKYPGTPQARQARKGLAACYTLVKDFDNARQQYDLLLNEMGGAKSPDGFEIFLTKLQMMTRLGENKKAIDEMIQTSPTLADLPAEPKASFMGSLAAVYYLDKQPEKAGETLNAMLNLARTGPDTHLALINVVSQLGSEATSHTEVLDFYRRFSEQFPESPMKARVLFETAKMNQALGRTDEANAYLDKAIEAQKQILTKAIGEEEISTDLFQLGNLYQARNNIDQARATYQKIVDHYPKSPRTPIALMFLSEIAYRAGDVKTAQDNLRRIVAEFPNSHESPSAAEALKVIAQQSSHPTTGTMPQDVGSSGSMSQATHESSTSPTAAGRQ